MQLDWHTFPRIRNVLKYYLKQDYHINTLLNNNYRYFTKELNVILDWIDKLNEVDTEGIEPLTNMTAETNIFREDIVKSVMTHEEGLKNAPKKDSNYFRVPKVLDKN